MKALILDKAELLALLRGTGPVGDQRFVDEAGDVIEGLAAALREIAYDREGDRERCEMLFEEACEASGIPAALLFFLHDFEVLMNMVEDEKVFHANVLPFPWRGK